MLSKKLYKFTSNLKKAALHSKETVELEDFTSYDPANLLVIKEPFPHIIIENFFKPDIYAELCEKFTSVKKRGFIEEKKSDGTHFHLFNMDYDGYVYSPQGTLEPQDPLRLFFSLEWNRFFSKIFHQFTTLETTFAFHHHPAGDKSGFVHHDHADMRFNSRKRLENDVIWSQSEPADIKRRRIISILFYLNNDSWTEGDGGETGIYSADKKTLLKKVPPINNTLFAFQTSPKSMHAFQENKKERDSMVQWFHIPPELL